MTFNHEKLKVYQRALPFNVKASKWIAEWDGRHTICDHLGRAAGSILENIAMGSASYSGMKVKSLDYAMGSTLECAACLDLARLKKLMDDSLVESEKAELSQIFRMMIGLRQTWSAQMAREESPEYDAETRGGRADKADSEVDQKKIHFHHEDLDVYVVALQAAEVFAMSEHAQRLLRNTFRRLDVLVTSMVLNIAEGNGRYSTLDQQRFLGISHEAAVKMAARLDLCAIQQVLPVEEVEDLKTLLSRVAMMTSAMMKG